MRTSHFVSIISVAALATISATRDPSPHYRLKHILSSLSSAHEQQILNQNPIMNIPPATPPSPDNDDQPSPPNDDPTGPITISDILPTLRSINIFSSFTRDISQVSTLLSTPTSNTTLLAPLNSALQSLPRKPWEDPKDYERLGTAAYDGAGGSDRAAKNLQRFVEAHVVPRRPWERGEKVETLGGGTIWWEDKNGKRIIQPGEVQVKEIKGRVGNGEVWVLEGVVNYE